MNDGRKPIHWVGSVLRDLRLFPDEVRRVMGHALDLAQLGSKHPSAKPLKGYGGAGVLEIVDDFDGNACRGLYTVRFPGAVYVLHAFQKKSRRGISTPRGDLELIAKRLRDAERHHADMK